VKIILLFFLYITLCSSICFSQQKTSIYLFPGQGSDKRIFDSLTFDTTYNVVNISYITPEKRTSLEQYARILSAQIDTTGKYILIGVSLGGMICTEINEMMKPEKVIIISSAKNRTELPFRYRFQKVIPIYRIIPARLLLCGAKILQPIVEPDRNQNKSTFKSMLSAKDPKYIKRTIEMIIKWKRTSNSKKIIHIHGNNDHTIPIRNVNCNFIIDHGSHMMTLTRFEQINDTLSQILVQPVLK
jgi:hypothetical protein